MKITTSTSVLAAATVAYAQTYNTSGPFELHLANSANATLNGQKLFACHAGAAIEGLCLSEILPSNDTSPSTTFYHNYTDYSSSGPLVWNLPVRISDSIDHVSEPMAFSYQPGSNVAVPLFSPGYDSTYVDFNNVTNKMTVSQYYDDSTFKIGQYPNSSYADLSQWYACWAEVGGYFYHALAWVTSGTPHNPTCQAVDVIKVDL